MGGGMKAAPARAMTKGAIADALATSAELKKSVVTKLLGSLAEVGAAEVKKSGVFTIPGLARIKTRRKPATKATKRMMFGKETIVKAKHSQRLRSRALPFDLGFCKASLISHRVGISTARYAIFAERTCWPCGVLATTAIVYEPQQELGAACAQQIMPH